ncbi:MAG: cupin domain-containing protein [Actinobacteria bacterium]|nr:cupin domain-containing protein [Actinomycetota bacterium]
MTQVFNLLDEQLEAARHSRDGHRVSERSFGTELGALHASLALYELPPGQAAAAYHYELTREEWLFVVSGELTLRTPAGERVLQPGSIVCFRPGAEGAHAVRNDSHEPVRYAMTSTKEESRSIVYPDSGKIAVVGPGFKRIMKLGEDLDYWDGER